MIRKLMWMMFGLQALGVVTLIAVVDAGRGQQLPAWIAQVPAGDKWGHFLLFGGLAFLANVAMNGRRIRWGSLTMLKGSVVVLIPTVLEEFSQIFFRSRTFDLLDLVADFVGILLGGWLAGRVLRSMKLLPVGVSSTESSGRSLSSPSFSGE
jgi:VanZ family protein